MSLKTILLDLDGVIVDFVGPAMRLHEVDYTGEWDYPMEFGFDVWKACNKLRKDQGLKPVKQQKFWENLSGERFWTDLMAYPGALDFFDKLCDMFDPHRIVIATSAIGAGSSLAGKFNWIQRWMPRWKRLYSMGAPKWIGANEGAILIDDSEDNINAFREEGGRTLLVPRPWNCFKTHESPYWYILKNLEMHLL